MRSVNWLTKSIILLILCFSTFVFAEINVDDEKVVKDVVSDFFLYYRERNFEKLNDLIDMDSPVMRHGVGLTGEVDHDISTASLANAITLDTSGNTKSYHFNINFIKQRFEEYPYGWIKADIKEIKIISEKGILVVANIFDNGINPANHMFYATENNNFRIVLTKKSGTWKIADIAHMFDRASDNPYFLTFKSDLKVIEGNFEEALQGFRDALMLKPNLSYAHFGLALVYLRDPSLLDKDPHIVDKAFDELGKAIEIRPDVPFYHQFLGWMHEMNGNKSKAEEEYNSALHLASDFPL